MRSSREGGDIWSCLGHDEGFGEVACRALGSWGRGCRGEGSQEDEKEEKEATEQKKQTPPPGTWRQWFASERMHSRSWRAGPGPSLRTHPGTEPGFVGADERGLSEDRQPGPLPVGCLCPLLGVCQAMHTSWVLWSFTTHLGSNFYLWGPVLERMSFSST